jgi:hypothetical protein
MDCRVYSSSPQRAAGYGGKGTKNCTRNPSLHSRATNRAGRARLSRRRHQSTSSFPTETSLRFYGTPPPPPEMPSPSPPRHATTYLSQRSPGQIYRTMPASRPHVSSTPSTSAHHFFNPNPRSIHPPISLSPIITLSSILPARWLRRSGQNDRTEAASFDQPFFTPKLVPRAIAGCPRFPWKMEENNSAPDGVLLAAMLDLRGCPRRQAKPAQPPMEERLEVL